MNTNKQVRALISSYERFVDTSKFMVKSKRDAKRILFQYAYEANWNEGQSMTDEQHMDRKIVKNASERILRQVGRVGEGRDRIAREFQQAFVDLLGGVSVERVREVFETVKSEGLHERLKKEDESLFRILSVVNAIFKVEAEEPVVEEPHWDCGSYPPLSEDFGDHGTCYNEEDQMFGHEVYTLRKIGRQHLKDWHGNGLVWDIDHCSEVGWEED